MTGWEIIGQALVGWLIADFFTGLLHWIGDSEHLGKTKLVSRISGLNVGHHADPLAITRESYWTRNKVQIVGSILIGAAIWSVFGLSVWLLAAVVGGMISGEVHKWAHSPKTAPSWVKLLQEIGVFQSPKHHAVHHRPPHQVNFCILTNWLNPVLDKLKLWKRIDSLFAKKS